MSINTLDLEQGRQYDELAVDLSTVEIAVNPYNSVEVISDIDEFLALREQWNEINEVSEKGTVFNSWEWMYTWWETYQKQGNRSLYILSCTNIHNELLGIAPFQIVNNPKSYFPCNKQLIMLGAGETDGSSIFGEYTDLIIKQGHETAFISALTDFLAQQSELWDGVKFQQQLIGSYVSKLFETRRNQEASYVGKYSIIKTIVEDGFRTYIDLPETYIEYLMSLRKKMRNNITRTYKRLESEQEFTIESVTTESEIKSQITGNETAIEVLAKLNLTRRSSIRKRSVFERPRFREFHSRVIKRLLPLNKISLRFLKFGDEPVAALYSYIDKGTVHAYQSGFDSEKGHRYSLLTTMLTQEISDSIKNANVSRFNFMYSDKESTYKKRYSGTTEKMYNISYDKQGFKFSIYRFIHGPVKALAKWLLRTT